MATMEQVVCEAFGPPQQLQRLQVDVPSPGPDEVLLRVEAAGVGFVDGLMIQGLYQVKPKLPYYPGSEFAGVVSTVGAQVSHLSPGDRVMGLSNGGAFADYLTVKSGALVPIPEALPSTTAAGFYINYATALYGLRDCGQLQPDETILVLGAAGGVGSAAIAVAKAMGARVIAAASSTAKRTAALAYGADQVIDYHQANWRDEVKSMVKDSGLNMVYDPVGGDVAEPAFRCLSPGGRFLVVGFASGTIPKLPLNLALLKRASLVGVDWGGESRANPSINTELMSTLMDWIIQGKLKPAAVTCRPMQDYQQALIDQLAGAVVGKLVLTN
jgi:NADPH:quinone reductase